MNLADYLATRIAAYLAVALAVLVCSYVAQDQRWIPSGDVATVREVPVPAPTVPVLVPPAPLLAAGPAGSGVVR